MAGNMASIKGPTSFCFLSSTGAFRKLRANDDYDTRAEKIPKSVQVYGVDSVLRVLSTGVIIYALRSIYITPSTLFVELPHSGCVFPSPGE